MIYKEWKFENGIRVEEVDCDDALHIFKFCINRFIVDQDICNDDLHIFKVYSGDRYLGNVWPSIIEDMNECIAQLNDGSDPVTDSWEDGYGNPCTLDGWGKCRLGNQCTLDCYNRCTCMIGECRLGNQCTLDGWKAWKKNRENEKIIQAIDEWLEYGGFISYADTKNGVELYTGGAETNYLDWLKEEKLVDTVENAKRFCEIALENANVPSEVIEELLSDW